MKKFIIIVVLMNVIACSSKPAATLETITKPSHSPNFKEMIPVGTWEGINHSEGEVKVLKITANDQHSLTSYNIVSGMQLQKSLLFTNKDIECDKFNCHIYVRTATEKLPIKVTFTKFVEGYLVIEAVRLEPEGIYSTSYQLNAVKGKTIPEQFIAQDIERLLSIAATHKNTRFGYWAGTLTTANEKRVKFATLDYQPGQTATFTVFTPGLPYQAKMRFKPKWLQQNNGELTTKLQGAAFASELTLRYLDSNIIDGDFEQRFERYPERLISSGHFRLYRIKPPEHYKLPKYLEHLLR